MRGGSGFFGVRVALSACAFLLSACEAEPVGSGLSTQAAAAIEQAPAPRTFGAALELSQAVPVSDVLAEPSSYLGKTIQCSGVIARVCERAGCWLELRGENQPEQVGLRVPMAGHAFFISQDVVGRSARVEGLLTARELGAGERAHLESEGLKAIGPLALTAKGVVVY